MKRIEFKSTLYIDIDEVSPITVDQALFWGDKHQDFRFENTEILSVEEVGDEDD